MRIFQAAVAAADPERAVLRHLRGNPLADASGSKGNGSVFVIGAGKASAAMARAVEKRLDVAAGLINVPDGTSARLRRVELNYCGHPIPDERGVEGARRMIEIARRADQRDLVICVISGGASALLPAPAPPLTLEDKQRITRELLASGATIHEMNVVRKHLSLIKGGQLAAATRATVLTLILSDVVGDDPAVIGSGPTVADPSTVADAKRILKKYGISAPEEALHETPKQLKRARHVIVGNNRMAIDAAAACARKLGYRPLVLSTTVEGETREIARMHAAIAREILASGRPVKTPACVLSGGETTVTVRGKGLGGRNQEFVLAAALALEGARGVTVFSAGTDGIDGPTDAAGAVSDGRVAGDARAFLDNNDAYHYFERSRGLIQTGPTGTNVMDVRVMLISSKRPASSSPR